jgi:hypothetical protein
MTDNIAEIILNRRPTISQGSLRTYRSILLSIAKKIGDIPPLLSADYYRENVDKILELISNNPLNTRKTQLSALYVLTEYEPYHKAMMEDISTSRDVVESQQMSKREEENWLPFTEIKKLYGECQKSVQSLWNKQDLTTQDRTRLQQFVIFSLVGGVHIPPRRLLDWTECKLRNYDTDVDNYIEDGKFVFNNYKTAKKYGRQEIKIPVSLRVILTTWKAINPMDYLLVNTKGEKLTTSLLNSRIGELFPKKIGVSMLRHIYISDVVHTDTPKFKKLKEIASAMGHSMTMNLLYKKELGK